MSQEKQLIIFSKDALPISDFDIEEFFENNKRCPVVELSSEVVLLRWRVAVKEGDIPPPVIKVLKEDGTNFFIDVTEEGRLDYYAGPTDPLDLQMDLLSRLL